MNSVEGDEEEEEEENQLLLEPNCVQYRLYFDDIVSSNDDNCELEDADADAHHRSLLEQRKREIFECIFSNSMLHSSSSSSMMTTTRKIQNEKRIETYCWHRDGFNLEVHFCPDAKRWCLKGETKFQDAMDDEWMVVHVLTRAASECLYPNSCSMRIFDDDGEFLLVEASHLLPTWVEPNVAEGRTFVRGGAVRVVGDVSDFHNNNIDDDDGSEGNAQSRRTALKTNAEALDALIASCSFSSDEDREKKYSLGEAIDGYLKETKMKKYQTDEAILTSRHLARALLPRRVRNALRVISKEEEEERKRSDEMTTMTPTTKQTFIQTAARMFYERTPTDVRSSKEFRNLNLTEAVEDDAKRSVMDSVTLRFSRCAYAQLARAKFDAPRKYPMDVVAKTTDVDVHNAFDVGMKLVVGMEIALEKLLSEDVDEEEKASAFNAVEIAAILRFKDALDRAEETEHKDDDDNDSEFSDSLEPESDQWMRDGMLELDNEILARAAEREMHPLSEDDEDAFDDFGLDDDDILDERREKEKAFNEDVKRVGKKLGTFMNAKATYKGAEGVDDGNSRSSYSKKIAPPELDADAFERDLMNALMDDPESEQFLEQFTKDLVFNDESVVGASSSSMHASRKVADDVQNELDLQAEDFDVAYEAALREQLLGSHVEESVKRTTVTSMDPNGEEGGTNVDERESIENETIKDVLKSAVMQNGQSGPASILLGTLEEKGSSSKE